MILPTKLSDFAYIPGWHDKLKRLEGLIIKENWKFTNPDPSRKNNQNPILENYVTHNYERLAQEREYLEGTDKNRKICIKENEVCFNTGLVNDDYEYIYMYFEKNPNSGAQPWKFKDFFKESSPYYLKKFGALPKKAEFFTELNELIFDTSKEIIPNFEHIMQRKDRLPEKVRDLSNFENIFNGALKRAERKIEINYKSAVPKFYQGNIQFLIPLCLEDKNKVDTALVVEEKGLSYFGFTCLTLEMAYSDARTITKPESDWLLP